MPTAQKTRPRSFRHRVHARGAIVRTDRHRLCAAIQTNCLLKRNTLHRSCTRLGTISQDPIGFAAGDANLYRYVGNQPTTKTDPSGLQPPNLTPEEINEIINARPIRPRSIIGGVPAGASGPSQLRIEQARLDQLNYALKELESILKSQVANNCLPKEYSHFKQRQFMMRKFPRVGINAEWSVVIESIRYTYENYTTIGAGKVVIAQFGGTMNMPGIPGMHFRRVEFFNDKAIEVALVNFVHEANHDWCRFGFEDYDHVTNPVSVSDIGKLTRSLIALIDWVETYYDPATGLNLLQTIMEEARKKNEAVR
jgi:hypothetical protein